MLPLLPLVLDPVDAFFRFVTPAEVLPFALKFRGPPPRFPYRPPREVEPDLALGAGFLNPELFDLVE